MNARYLEKTCAMWADNGIVTHELAEQYLAFLKQERSNENAVKKLLGIGKPRAYGGGARFYPQMV